MDGDDIGAAMRLARRRLGLSQRALAEALGWDRSKVGRWEGGVVPEGFDEVVGLLRVLGFGMELTDPDAGRWADWDDPAEHVRRPCRVAASRHTSCSARKPFCSRGTGRAIEANPHPWRPTPRSDVGLGRR